MLLQKEVFNSYVKFLYYNHEKEVISNLCLFSYALKSLYHWEINLILKWFLIPLSANQKFRCYETYI